MQIKKNSSRFFIIIILILCLVAALVAMLSFFHTTPVNAPKPTQETHHSQKNKSTPPPEENHSINDPSSYWVIVNKQRPLKADFAPSNLTTPNVAINTAKSQEENSLRADIAPKVVALFNAAQQAGHTYILASGYRSFKLQNTYYTNYVATSGQAEADRFSARPGTSEHQTGLALDVATVDRIHYLDQAFGEDAAGRWLADHAFEYGFIIRYLPGKESITGYMYEPWHIRYVGESLAKKLYERNQTMEEYFHL